MSSCRGTGCQVERRDCDSEVPTTGPTANGDAWAGGDGVGVDDRLAAGSSQDHRNTLLPPPACPAALTAFDAVEIQAWFTYQIPDDAPSAPGAYVTFQVAAGGGGPIGYDYSSDMDEMVGLCVDQSPISGGYGTPTSGSVIVHPGS